MRRFTRSFLHSYAFLKRGSPPSLSFNSFASTPEAADVETRAANVRKTRKVNAEKIGCGSPSTSVAERSRPTIKSKAKAAERSRPTIKSKAKANIAEAKSAKFSESEAAHVHENAATQKTMASILHVKSVFKERKALPMAAVDRSDEIKVNAAEGANDGMTHAKGELSEWAANLDLNSSKTGRRWIEVAYKLLDYGISSAHVQSMLQKCRKLPCARSSDSILEHFNALGMSHEEMGSVISRWPTILNLSNNSFQTKVEFFESVGIDRRSLGKIMHKAYRVVALSPSVLRGRYEFWNDFFQDVEENAFRNMVSRYPQILAWNLQTTVKPNLAYLEELGLSLDKKLLLRGSPLLSYNANTLALKLKLLEQFCALNVRSLASALVVLSMLRMVKLHERLHNLFAFGFSFDQVKRIMTMCPQVLAYREDRTNLRLNYAVNVLNLSLDVLAVCPPFWSSSLEKRIKYRYEVLQKLRALGVHGKEYSLGYMLAMSGATFSRKFLEPLQAYTKYIPASR